MILYHGSKEVVKYPEIRKARFHKDFLFRILLHTVSGTGEAMGRQVWNERVSESIRVYTK